MKNAGFQARRSILQPPGVAGWLCKYRYAANRGGKEGCCMRKEFRYPELAPYAKGEKPAGVVFKHAKVFCVFTGELLEGDLACQDGIVVGLGSYTGEKEIDCTGKVLIPGLIDAHLHMESTLVAPSRLVHAAARFGTTTYIMDPHEAANVAGMDGFPICWRIQRTHRAMCSPCCPRAYRRPPSKTTDVFCGRRIWSPTATIPGCWGWGK